MNVSVAVLHALEYNILPKEMAGFATTSLLPRRLRWSHVYSQAELCRAALRVYTKPLFHWRKALSTSTDGKTLYDFAARGLRGMDALPRSLERQIGRRAGRGRMEVSVGRGH